MSTERLTQWLERLGYLAEADALHRAGDTIAPEHPYAIEMQALLKPDGAIRAEAVFDVEGVPTVAFFSALDGKALDEAALDLIRQRLWNQNLTSLVIAFEPESARVMPVRQLRQDVRLAFADADPEGEFSPGDVRSNRVVERLPQWFDAKARVDRALIENISEAVSLLAMAELTRRQAQILMSQVLFVSYLEHRGIVSAHYRKRRDVGSLHALVRAADREGMRHLLDCLRDDFNGDFLADGSDDSSLAPWSSITSVGFAVLDHFLSRVQLSSGQRDFWNYDFSFIPVELLSGLYESFLDPDQKKGDGAVYTPRDLASLAVDQAFAASADPLADTIFDGACGSGILLTTAYRRLIALQQARSGRVLSFAERRQLLLDRIFGGDINPMACRVTAFSLYLSLLEGLAPADVLAAQEQDGVRLPTLRGTNLCDGPSADIFGDEHPFAGRRFSQILSNPPWNEVSGEESSADRWAKRAGVKVALRQLATAYSMRALDFLANNGRLCLILPITQFLGSTSARFVPAFLQQVQPLRLINFGDLQALLFPTAENTCHVFVGVRRDGPARELAALTETFDYWVPKADLSRSLGRLTLQSSDRHQLQTQAVQDDPKLLVNLMWGDSFDLALLARLGSHGTLGELWTGRNARWVARKGVHLEDKTRGKTDAGPLRLLPYVPIGVFTLGVPRLEPDLLTEWPVLQTTIAGTPEKYLSIFDGPRVLYPDGFSSEEPNIRASYIDVPAAFNHSIGVIQGPREDAPLLRFLAIFLRSNFGRYLLMLNCAKMLSERNAAHLVDLEPFPFFAPDQAPDPKAAHKALAAVLALDDAIQTTPGLTLKAQYELQRAAFDALVLDYFGLDEIERAVINETATVLSPSIRPRAYKRLATPLQAPVYREHLNAYSEMLAQVLDQWRDRLGGRGSFSVDVVATEPSRLGATGVVRVSYREGETTPSDTSLAIDRARVQEALLVARRMDLDRLKAPEGVEFRFGQLVWTQHGLYIARVLQRRNWLLRTAIRDAEAIVRSVQRGAVNVQAVA
jgi:hypothetical protein